MYGIVWHTRLSNQYRIDIAVVNHFFLTLFLHQRSIHYISSAIQFHDILPWIYFSLSNSFRSLTSCTYGWENSIIFLLSVLYDFEDISNHSSVTKSNSTPRPYRLLIDVL